MTENVVLIRGEAFDLFCDGFNGDILNKELQEEVVTDLEEEKKREKNAVLLDYFNFSI